MFRRLIFSGLASAFLALGASCGSSAPPDASDGGTSNPDAGSITDAGGGADAIAELASLEQLLSELRSDRDAALRNQSRAQGWPAPVEGGYLFVSASGLGLLAGDHDEWVGSSMTAEDDFHWLVRPVANGSRYKFTDGADTWLADPWSRSYTYDDFGEMSTVAPATAHRERFFAVGDAELQERVVRVWVPEGSASHLLYAHDGQNLFDPNAPYGGWKMDEVAPAGLMIVGIDFTEFRTWEYTYTTEPTASGPLGGGGDLYAAFVQNTVRELVRTHYGEPSRVGVIGSSFGGIMSLHMADRYPGQFDFVASLSGTVDWGSWAGTGTDTMINRYKAAGHRNTAIYIDSGGNGTTCVDSDGDGSNDDDPTETDKYCLNLQFKTELLDIGYVLETDLWHHWTPDALHNEAAWAARVAGPFQIFMDL
jgi:predicted alpha/beta superfamily hydrolase